MCDHFKYYHSTFNSVKCLTLLVYMMQACIFSRIVIQEHNNFAIEIISFSTTDSGPIRRQVVRTKDGGKRTFMILNKNSLKTLQAKGVIQQLKQSKNDYQL